MGGLYGGIVERAGKDEMFSHSFFLKVKEMIENGDGEGLLREKIPLKLLRLSPDA